MEPIKGYSPQSYAPSAPPLPPEQHQSPSQQQEFEHISSSSGFSYGQLPAASSFSPSSYGSEAFCGAGSGNWGFPPGMHPWIIQCFRSADRDGSGFIDETELQTALSQREQRFSSRTVRLLVFLFSDPSSPSKIGPTEFAAIWDCVGQWRATFERFDTDRSGEIDSRELRDAMLSIGYLVPESVIQVLLSKYKHRSRQGDALSFDSFLECGLIVKGLTERFKEKDPQCTGYAKLNYDAFMSMVIPFIVP